jgi:hypothetical protein
MKKKKKSGRWRGEVEFKYPGEEERRRIMLHPGCLRGAF